LSTIIWIDPWTTTTWYAIIKKQNRKVELLDYGIFKTEPWIEIWDKLMDIGDDLNSIIKKYKPTIAVVEKLYFTNNIKTWIDVSHARGVMIYILKSKWIKIEEYTPLELKNAITWYGKASKKQMQNAIKIILHLEGIPKPDDAADAIWLAYMGM